MYFKGQKFFIAGISVSGESSARFLLERGATVFVYDDVVSDNIAAVEKQLELLGAHIVQPEKLEEAVNACDILVLSPGIPIDTTLPVLFRRQNKAIIGEEELASLYLRATGIAVTGTNGKTTTVSMLAEAMKAAGCRVSACGNNGNPLIKEVANLGFDDYAVIEISSFQLETLSSIRPHIAIVTNITEDHLDRHYNMENYVFLKSKLLRNMRESEYAVLNYDDPTVRSFSEITKAKCVYFSMRSRVDGAYFEDGSIYFNGEKYFDVSDLTVNGVHNVYNALACVAAAGILGLDKTKIAEAICAFKGISHRIEKVRTVKGVTYIDDSKGTNMDATLKAVKTMTKPTILLLGGKDKGEEYDGLFEEIAKSRVIHTVIYGENRFKLLNAAIRTGFNAFSLCESFKTAVCLAEMIAKPEQCVLLSPASASFDSFANYEERGDAFKELVEKINEG